MPTLNLDQLRTRLSIYTIEKEATKLEVEHLKAALLVRRKRVRKLTEAQERLLRLIKENS